MDRDDRGGEGGPGQRDEGAELAADTDPRRGDAVGGDEPLAAATPSTPSPPDDPNDPDLAPPAAPTLGRVPPVNRAMARMGRRLGGRPIAVYGVLAAGGVVLLILLLIVWFSAGGGGEDDVIPCFNAGLDEAVALVKDGQVEGVSIVSPPRSDDEVDADLVLPTLLRIELNDGTCRNLQPQGPLGEIPMYTVLGVVDWYNLKTVQRRIDIDVNESDGIPARVLATMTPAPTATEPATQTPEPPATPVADTPVPTGTATPEPTGTPTPAIDGVGSPVASPMGSLTLP